MEGDSPVCVDSESKELRASSNPQIVADAQENLHSVTDLLLL